MYEIRRAPASSYNAMLGYSYHHKHSVLVSSKLFDVAYCDILSLVNTVVMEHILSLVIIVEVKHNTPYAWS